MTQHDPTLDCTAYAVGREIGVIPRKMTTQAPWPLLRENADQDKHCPHAC